MMKWEPSKTATNAPRSSGQGISVTGRLTSRARKMISAPTRSDDGRWFGGRAVSAALIIASSACEPRVVDVQLVAEGRALSGDERHAIQDIADSALREVRTLLPTLPKKLTLVVQPGKDVIPETGETATAVPPASVYWTVDPDRNFQK